MLSFFSKPHIFLFFIILASLLVFSPALTTFFSADDFYNMRLVMNDSFGEVLKSFLFERRGDFLFYRPLTTQLYFFLTKPIFGLNPVGYHLISLTIFIGIIILVYKLAFILTERKYLALLTSFFYAFSSSNLTRLAWVVQVQELALGFFVLLGIFTFVSHQEMKKSNLYIASIICFILALMSKESAVVFPFLALLATLSRAKPLIKRLSWEKMRPLIPFFIVLSVYLYLRFVKMGISTGEYYFTSFSPRAILNTLFWYTLWGIGIPEELVNFDLFGPGLRINQQLINVFISDIPLVGLGGLIFFTILIMMLFWGFIVFLRRMRRIEEEKEVLWRIALFGISWFILALIPHLFSPWHKFAYELTVPLFGLSLGLATLLQFSRHSLSRHLYEVKNIAKDSERRRDPSLTYGLKVRMTLFNFSFYGLLLSYLFLSIITIRFEQKNHWVFRRGKIARRVFSYLARYHPYLSKDKSIVLLNDWPGGNRNVGFSRQISLALFDDAALQLFYNNPELEVYYQDEDDLSELGGKAIILQASFF